MDKQTILNKCPSFIELVDGLPMEIAIKHQEAIKAISSFICNPQYKIRLISEEKFLNALPAVVAFLEEYLGKHARKAGVAGKRLFCQKCHEYTDSCDPDCFVPKAETLLRQIGGK